MQCIAANLVAYVAKGSWLCKNAKTLNRDRRSYSSKTALVAQLASDFNLEVELKNIILVVFRFFEFLHSQGQTETSARSRATSGPPRLTDITRPAQLARFLPTGNIEMKKAAN